MTSQEILMDILQGSIDERRYLIKYKRNGTKYVDPEDREVFVQDNYIIFLARKCLKAINNGHSVQKLVSVMEEEDWINYSFSSRCYWTIGDLSYHLNVKVGKKVTLTDLLFMQAEYLQKASDMIVQSLKDEDF